MTSLAILFVEPRDRPGRTHCWNYRRIAAFRCAFFSLRGSRDLFFGSSFPTLVDLVDGLAAAGGASVTATAIVDSVVSVTSFFLGKMNQPHLNCSLFAGYGNVDLLK